MVVIDSLEHLCQLRAALKKSASSLITNCYLDKETIESYIYPKKLFYSYEPGGYLNIYYKERDFFRLYYYIADLDTYRIQSDNKKIICEQFWRGEDEKSERVNLIMKRRGLQIYAKYHKWIRKGEEALKECNNKDKITILEGNYRGYYEAIEQYFDVFSDHIPLYEEADKYFSSKKCYSAVEMDSQKLLGGLVVTKQGNVQTEEFIFVDKAHRNKGVAGQLHNYWYMDSISDNNRQFVAWIRDDNKESIQFHLKNNYMKKPIYKVTMMKG